LNTDEDVNITDNDNVQLEKLDGDAIPDELKKGVLQARLNAYRREMIELQLKYGLYNVVATSPLKWSQDFNVWNFRTDIVPIEMTDEIRQALQTEIANLG
jgi:hypothetical protein